MEHTLLDYYKAIERTSQQMLVAARPGARAATARALRWCDWRA